MIGQKSGVILTSAASDAGIQTFNESIRWKKEKGKDGRTTGMEVVKLQVASCNVLPNFCGTAEPIFVACDTAASGVTCM